MAASVGSEDGDLGFQIAPMVDVVFVLMLFFMAVTGMKMQEYLLHAKLPGVPSKEHVVPGVIRIDITEEGVVSVNDTRCGDAHDPGLPELRAWLRNVLGYGTPDPVIIQPAPGTMQDRIIHVLDACATEKFTNVAFN